MSGKFFVAHHKNTCGPHHRGNCHADRRGRFRHRHLADQAKPDLAPAHQLDIDLREQLRVEPDQGARVVIDERSGIIVMGKDVRVSTVAVAQGNLTVTISEQPQVSQPEPFSRGQTVVTPRTSVKVDTQGGNKLALVKESVALAELVDGLNALGIGPRDLIAILQAIKSAGALQAEIEVM